MTIDTTLAFAAAHEDAAPGPWSSQVAKALVALGRPDWANHFLLMQPLDNRAVHSASLPPIPDSGVGKRGWERK